MIAVVPAGRGAALVRSTGTTSHRCAVSTRPPPGAAVTTRPFKALSKRHISATRVHASASTDTLQLFSPSKINVFLRIIRRREDGFHDLASLFHVIDLGDQMEFQLLPGDAEKDTLSCNMEGVPTDESNLVIKALNLYRSKTGATQRFHISLEKTVPHGAGLGGGSANAATTLFAANRMCGGLASESDLLEWSGEIGSDISVFFSHGAAYCTGRGEVVEDVSPPLPLDMPILLVKPPIGLSTPQIFKALDLERRSSADPLQLLKGLAAEGRCTPDLCVNDLEQPAFDTLPELLRLKERLTAEGKYSVVFMTGSGSTIVAVGDDTPPEWLSEGDFGELFVSKTRLITRQPGEWYVPSTTH
mmetsp:Transcript_4970/g.9053  ORF Transcript_4970/g.9053 Transcript_4970/m.9053 type:complete len:359 (-) Transcript_4970:199-1275(-)